MATAKQKPFRNFTVASLEHLGERNGRINDISIKIFKNEEPLLRWTVYKYMVTAKSGKRMISEGDSDDYLDAVDKALKSAWIYIHGRLATKQVRLNDKEGYSDS